MEEARGREIGRVRQKGREREKERERERKREIYIYREREGEMEEARGRERQGEKERKGEREKERERIHSQTFTIYICLNSKTYIKDRRIDYLIRPVCFLAQQLQLLEIKAVRKQITKVHPPLTYAPRSLFPSMTFFYIEKNSHEIEYLHCVSACNGKVAQQIIKLFSHRV